MKLTCTSTLRDVVTEVGSVLSRGGVRAVLTGGACASIYSRGIYQSADVDFILVSDTTRHRLDELPGTAGLRRSGDRYVHPETRYYVEFPRGPLTIGSDDKIVPVELSVKGRSFLALSATDSCRDRLAATASSYKNWSTSELSGADAAQRGFDAQRLKFDGAAYSTHFRESAVL